MTPFTGEDKGACPGQRHRGSRRRLYGLPLLALPFIAVSLLMAPAPTNAGYCLAGTCHATIISKQYLHGPVTLEKQAQGGCILCHVPAGPACSPAAGGKFEYANRWDDLCMGCHGGTIEPDHKLPARPCVICHDPHGSNFSKRLFRKGILNKENSEKARPDSPALHDRY